MLIPTRTLAGELDDARAEIERLRAENARLAREFAEFRGSHAVALALRERDAVINACVAESYRSPDGRPDAIECCWEWNVRAMGGFARTREEAVAAVRRAAGLDREGEESTP